MKAKNKKYLKQQFLFSCCSLKQSYSFTPQTYPLMPCVPLCSGNGHCDSSSKIFIATESHQCVPGKAVKRSWSSAAHFPLPCLKINYHSCTATFSLQSSCIDFSQSMTTNAQNTQNWTQILRFNAEIEVRILVSVWQQIQSIHLF